MVARLQRLATQCGSRMLATCPALRVFQRENPRPTNGPNYQQFIAQL
jgi:hypothetical protein